MISALSRRVVILLAVCAACTAFAQQPELTEPPVPRAAPLSSVAQETLPRVGGVIVFGGNRGLGLETVTELVHRGEKVTAMVRPSSDATGLKALGVNIITGDALSPDDLKKAFSAAPFRAVVSTISGGTKDLRPDVEGNKNIVDAAKATGIPYVVLVSAVGAGDSKEAEPWYFDYFLKDLMAAKTAAEDYVRASGLQYTIVRPGWLTDWKPSGKAVLTADKAKFSWIARGDVAKLIADCLKNQSMVGKVVTSFDPSRDSVWKLVF